MRVDVAREPGRFVYHLEPDTDDPREMLHTDSGGHETMRLVGDRWEVQLPAEFAGIHPDLHAAAIWLTLEPFVGSRLTLPFGVSRAWAEHAAATAGVAFPTVDPTLSPRKRPAGHRAGLLFSGGFDSLASSLLLPDDAVCVQTTRIPRDTKEWPGLRAQVEAHMAGKALLRRRVAATGRRVYPLFEDHEALYRPYPKWHSGQRVAQLAPLYLADSLGLSVVEWGDILGNVLDLGFRFDRPSRWSFERARLRYDTTPEDTAASRFGTRFGERGDYALLGLTKGSSVAALSTVGTALVVHRSVHRGEALPCDFAYPDELPTWGVEPVALYCMRCNRCFQKILLDHAIRDQELPANLVDHFLRFPDVAADFVPAIIDWHHVWLYVFQRLRCDHPFVRILQRQARRAPDLGLLEKWCPAIEHLLPQQPYGPTVRDRALRYVELMTDAEVEELAAWDLPPFDTSEFAEYLTAATTPGAPPAEHRGAPPGGLRARPDTLVLRFRDATGRLPDHVFCVGRVEDGEKVFLRHGPLGVAHDPCAPTKAFGALGRFVAEALRAASPAAATSESWFLRTFLGSRLRGRFHLDVARLGAPPAGPRA
jgi:hypothetical protein